MRLQERSILMAKINFSHASFKGAFVDPEALNKTHASAEFIILGRSNVGKSSLINALTKKQIAKTSSTPGKTETINHFMIDELISLYDLPGYGFAKFKTKRLGWADFIDQFIETKGAHLKGFLLLIDIRHPLSEEDKVMLGYLHKFPSPLHVIFTKIDKLNQTDLKKQLEFLQGQIQELYVNPFTILTFSTKLPLSCKNLEKMIGIWAN